MIKLISIRKDLDTFLHHHNVEESSLFMLRGERDRSGLYYG